MFPPQNVTLSTKGQLVLPQALRKAAGLHAGSKLTLSLEADGSIRARPLRPNLEAFFDSLASLPAQEAVAVDAAIMVAVKELDDATHRR